MSYLKKLLLLTTISTISCVMGAVVIDGSSSDDDDVRPAGEGSCVTDGDIVNIRELDAVSVAETLGITLNPGVLKKGSPESLVENMPGAIYYPFTKTSMLELVTFAIDRIVKAGSLIEGCEKRLVEQLSPCHLPEEGCPTGWFNSFCKGRRSKSFALFVLQFFRTAEILLSIHAKDNQKDSSWVRMALQGIKFEKGVRAGVFIHAPKETIDILDGFNRKIYVDRQGIHVATDEDKFEELFKSIEKKLLFPGNLAKLPIAIKPASADSKGRLKWRLGAPKSTVLPMEGHPQLKGPDCLLQPARGLLAPSDPMAE